MIPEHLSENSKTIWQEYADVIVKKPRTKGDAAKWT